jgi:serine/threonine-protein kinase
MLETVAPPASAVRLVGRYALHDKIASGGMATVHFGRLRGASGFARTVAIKRLYPQFAEDPDFVAMFLDEARLASRIRSPYVVPTLDVVSDGGELAIVMEYVHGESLAALQRAVTSADEERPAAEIPVDVAVAVLAGVLEGLHAAHEARTEQGAPLGIVHRDVSPQNVLVGTDGLGHLIDFGVAKAVGRLQTTREGQLKGKLGYMAPEQLRGDEVTRRSDVYAASVVLWEALAGQRLFKGADEAAVVTRVLMGEVRAPSAAVRRDRDEAEVDAVRRLDEVVLQGLDRDPARRFETARDMAVALQARVPAASPARVAQWLEQVAAPALAQRAARLALIESGAAAGDPDGPQEPAGIGAAAATATQASSISVASTVRDAPKRRRRWVVAFAAVALLGVAVTGLRLSHSSSPSPTAASVGPAASPPPGLGPSDLAPSALGPASSAPTVASSVPAAASSPPSSPAASPASPSPRRPSTPPRSDCNPPFTWDAQGRKIYKRQCL